MGSLAILSYINMVTSGAIYSNRNNTLNQRHLLLSSVTHLAQNRIVSTLNDRCFERRHLLSNSETKDTGTTVDSMINLILNT